MANQQEPHGMARRAGKFMMGKGFYIVLLLCLTAIGVSGYVILSATPTTNPELPELPPIGLDATTAYSGVALATTPPRVTEPIGAVGAQTEIPDITAPPVTAPPATPQTSAPPRTAAAKVFYVRPLAGTEIRGYSDTTPVYNPTMDDWRVHTGLDIAAAAGEPICSVAAGTVVEVYEDYFKGVTVEILQLDGLTAVYCGLAADPDVVTGDSVTAGTVIGCVGETAIFESLDGPHLHFELYKGETTVDPALYLPAK